MSAIYFEFNSTLTGTNHALNHGHFHSNVLGYVDDRTAYYLSIVRITYAHLLPSFSFFFNFFFFNFVSFCVFIRRECTDWNQIQNSVSGCSQIKLMGLDLKDQGIAKLSKVLIGSSVTRLELTWLGFGSTGAKSLSNILPQTSIKSLIINGNLIEDDGVEAITKSMSQLQELELYEAGISSKGASKISKVLKSNIHLEVLNLYGNHIGNEGADVIASAITVRGHTQIIHFYLIVYIYSSTNYIFTKKKKKKVLIYYV